MIRDDWGWRGRVRVTSTFADGTQQIDEFDNMITDAGRNLMRDLLSGAAGDGEIKYIALGVGSAQPVAADVTLNDERFRKVVTKQENIGAGGLVTTVFIASFEANNFIIEEIGWFAGADATETRDSGVMVARVLYSRDKTALESLQIERIDTII